MNKKIFFQPLLALSLLFCHSAQAMTFPAPKIICQVRFSELNEESTDLINFPPFPFVVTLDGLQEPGKKPSFDNHWVEGYQITGRLIPTFDKNDIRRLGNYLLSFNIRRGNSRSSILVPVNGTQSSTYNTTLDIENTTLSATCQVN